MSKYLNESVFIGLGSNSEPREKYIEQAIHLIAEKHRVLDIAKTIETEPFGFESDTMFLNTAVMIQTTFSPLELLIQLKDIEKALGRTQKSTGKNYTSRTIDLDLLYFGVHILITPDLTLPHPEIQNRLFVLEPLFELAPDFIDPLRLKTISELRSSLLEKTDLKH
jgi:2-amino-4-hydroxy-6-hydroxymethyldihydropteridine diphosphokinase